MYAYITHKLSVRLDICACSMEYYMQKTYYKTASLIANSCKAIALLAGQTTEVATLAYDYGRNLVRICVGILD